MNDYRALLNSTEEYLQALKQMGVRHLAVRRETLAELGRPVAFRPMANAAVAVEAMNATLGSERSVMTRILGTPEAPNIGREVAMNNGHGARNGIQNGSGAGATGESENGVATENVNGAAGLAETGVGAAQSKEEAMRAIRERASACVKCPNLVRSRRNVVFGVGNIHSPLMFVGEAPGADEDAKGEPFVGAAGMLLTKIIGAMGFTRESVYIANILKCRPDTPGQSSGNRKPTGDEMKTCLPYLLAQIEVIRPKVIVALGATAIEGLLGRAEGITKLRGKFLEFRGIPLMPTFHPAYLLRNQAPGEKRKVWEDMLQTLERLGAPISEKQRGYFLPAAAAAGAA